MPKIDVQKPMQARSKETLSKILLACDALLKDRAFEQISMQDIAKEAGVSVGNLYNRFADRDALIDHVITAKQIEVSTYLTETLSSQPADCELKVRIAILAQAIHTSTKDLKPTFLSVASRQIAQSAELPEETQNNVQNMVDEFTRWLMLSSDEIQGQNKADKCAFVSASLAFALQFDVVFGTPSRLFGDGFIEQQVEMSYAYLIAN